MRFGAFVPQGWTLDLAGIPVGQQWDVISRVGRGLEAWGYESAWVNDHFHTVPEPTQEPTFEAWATMASLAASTETIRLGQMCTCNGFRSPTYLAHLASTVDVISGGRLELGIGAGWYENEFLSHGYEFPRPSTRISQLEESIRILKLMWTEETTWFEGSHYRVKGAICQPKPIQQPHIPFWIAGQGERFTLKVVAQHASYANFAGTPGEFQLKSDVLRSHCETLGRDFNAITRSMNVWLICADTEADAHKLLDDHIARLKPLVSDDRVLGEYLEKTRRLSGPPDKIIEALRPYAQRGLEYLIVRFPDAAYDLSGVELFGREVIGAI